MIYFFLVKVKESPLRRSHGNRPEVQARFNSSVVNCMNCMNLMSSNVGLHFIFYADQTAQHTISAEEKVSILSKAVVGVESWRCTDLSSCQRWQGACVGQRR